MGELHRLRSMHLFAGAGLGLWGDLLLGHLPVCGVEINPYRQRVLMLRQREGVFPFFPIWDDVVSFSGKEWKGRVEIVCGGFPCTNISVAGNQEGLEGEDSRLWFEMSRIIGEVGPEYVFVENSPHLAVLGGARVLADLAKMGYVGRYGVVGAVNAGAPHERERMWILAHAKQSGLEGFRSVPGTEKVTQSRHRGPLADSKFRRLESGSERSSMEKTVKSSKNCDENGKNENMADSKDKRHVRRHGQLESTEEGDHSGGSQKDGCWKWWDSEPGLGRVVDVCPNRRDRIEAIGDGQCPAVVELAWHILENLVIDKGLF